MSIKSTLPINVWCCASVLLDSFTNITFTGWLPFFEVGLYKYEALVNSLCITCSRWRRFPRWEEQYQHGGRAMYCCVWQQHQRLNLIPIKRRPTKIIHISFTVLSIFFIILPPHSAVKQPFSLTPHFRNRMQHSVCWSKPPQTLAEEHCCTQPRSKIGLDTYK